MKSKHKAAFTLIEALVAFMVFSLVLNLYLPAFYLEYQRMQNLTHETNRWRIFKELSQLELQYQGEASFKEALKQQVMSDYNEESAAPVTTFACSDLACYIQFADGVERRVDIQEINQ